MVKVILLADLPPHGRKGEIIAVNYGFAYNFLIKKQLATLATPDVIRQYQQKNLRSAQKLQEQQNQTKQQQQKINDTHLTFMLPASPTGQAQKVVTAKQILEQLSSKLDIPPSAVWMTNFRPIKTPGIYRLLIKLRFQLTARLKIVVGWQ